GHSPAIAERPVLLCQGPNPHGLASKIKTTKVSCAEKGIEMFAIGGWRGYGHAAGREQVGRRRAKKPRVPEQLAVLAVVAVDVQAIILPTVRRGQEDALAPDDRRTDAGPVERDFPAHVLRARPVNRQILLRRDTYAARPTPAGPVAREGGANHRGTE